MKQLNLSDKNLAILAAGTAAVGGIIFYFRSAITKTLSNAYAKISYKVYEPKIEFRESSFTFPKIHGQQELEQIELKLLSLTIKDSGRLYKLIQPLFSQSYAFEEYIRKNKDSFAQLMADKDIITIHPEVNGNINLLTASLAYVGSGVEGSNGYLTNLAFPDELDDYRELAIELAKVIGLHSHTEHSKESIAKFLQNAFKTKTTSSISKIFIKAEELEIFSATFKAFAKVEEENFGKVVSALVREEDGRLDKDKLVFFIKMMHIVDNADLDFICYALTGEISFGLEFYARLASKEQLQALYEFEYNRYNHGFDQQKSFSTPVQLSQAFTLIQDSHPQPIPVWISQKYYSMVADDSAVLEDASTTSSEALGVVAHQQQASIEI